MASHSWTLPKNYQTKHPERKIWMLPDNNAIEPIINPPMIRDMETLSSKFGNGCHCIHYDDF